jgi:hypothetical protein
MSWTGSRQFCLRKDMLRRRRQPLRFCPDRPCPAKLAGREVVEGRLPGIFGERLHDFPPTPAWRQPAHRHPGEGGWKQTALVRQFW